MPEWNIRQARKSDIESVMAVELDSFDPLIRENAETLAERIAVFPEGFLVLVGDGILSGYVSSELWHWKRDYSIEDFSLGHSIRDRHKANGTELYISSFAILNSARGTGAGSFLWREFQSHVGRCIAPKTWILLVSESWVPASHMYANSGFSETGRFSCFFSFSDGSSADGIIMRK